MEGLINKAMIGAMRDIGAITKGRLNEQQNFKFRGIDDVYNTMHEILATHGIVCVPTVLEDRTEDRVSRSGTALIYRVLKMRYSFIAEDGSFVDAEVIGEGMDSGDKASNKAMSIAQKYALLQTFLVPTEEEKDPDAESHEVTPKGTPVPKTPPPPPPAAPLELHDDLDIKGMQTKIAEMLLKVCGTVEDAGKKLVELTSFTGKDGTRIPGIADPFKLKDKPNAKGQTQTSVTYLKVRDLYEKWRMTTLGEYTEEFLDE